MPLDRPAHDVADLDLEPRVPGDLERLHLTRPEAVAAKNVANRCRVHAANLPGQRLESPVPGVCRRLHLVLLNRLLSRRARGVPQKTVDALREKALPETPRPVRQPGFPSCRFPARPPVSRFAGRSRWRREDNVTLPEKMEHHVLNRALVPYLKLIVHGSPRLQPPRCHPDRPQGKRLRHDQMTHQRVNPLK